MKKIIFIPLFIALGSLLLYFFLKSPELNKHTNSIKISKTEDKKTNLSEKKSIFVPYWNSVSDLDSLKNYDSLIYFGISAGKTGINREELGYKNLSAFVNNSKGNKNILTLRMLDDDINYYILANQKIQVQLIQETLKTVQENNFEGIALDLELNNYLDQKITSQINDFVQTFYTAAKKYYIHFSILLYGDVFYRGRPFDLPFLVNNSDEIMIMAYDFHKSKGEPGPNFPFDSGHNNNYSFKMMVNDYLKIVPKEKITVVFGMFGYDWLVDEKKLPIRSAKALSLNEIKSKFLVNCQFKDCLVKRDSTSQETEVNYIISAPTPDEQEIYRIDYHIIWFEDEESVKVKTEYLKEKGIGNIAYWAYGYF